MSGDQTREAGEGAAARDDRQSDGTPTDHSLTQTFLNGDLPAKTEDINDKYRAIDHLGSSIGPYRLLEAIGHGGMGVVYLAEQTEPVRRRVAVKVIKPGMDTAQVIARFEAERQALALMDHHHIARVLDAGATTEGRPYFVMELVRGATITEYCDHHRLSIPSRLDLFINVCQAVQHAHQKGIIHRDIKPSNILIAEKEGRPVVKVIDFGLAKALHQPLTDHTMFTAIGSLVGTPEYMSPEQAGTRAADVDTRTDVYSLGVLLYKLFTGTTPHDGKALRSLSVEEMLKTLRDGEAPPLRVRLTSLGDGLSSVAKHANVEPSRLLALVRGELEWIVAKALERDRNRRYATVDALAADVQRYLKGEAVEAGPPSTSYRLRKFAARFRGTLIAAGTISTIVIAALGVSLYQWQRAERSLQQKIAAERRLLDVGTLLAEGGHHANMLADNRQKQEYVLLGKSWLDEVEDKLSTELANDPVEPFVEHVVGVLSERIDSKQARTHLESALKKLEALDPESDKAMAARNHLAFNFANVKEYDQAARLHEQSLAILRSENPPQIRQLIQTIIDLARTNLFAQRIDAAIPQLREALDLAAQGDVIDVAQALDAVNHLATALGTDEVAWARNVDLFRSASQLAKQHRDMDPAVAARVLSNLGMAYRATNDLVGAVRVFDLVVKLRESDLGENHPDTILSLSDYGRALALAERGADADKQFAAALARSINHLGWSSSTSRLTAQRWADCLKNLEKMSGRDKYVRAKFMRPYTIAFPPQLEREPR